METNEAPNTTHTDGVWQAYLEKDGEPVTTLDEVKDLELDLDFRVDREEDAEGGLWLVWLTVKDGNTLSVVGDLEREANGATLHVETL